MEKTFNDSFIERMRQKRAIRKAKLPMGKGKFRHVKIEEHQHQGTDDVFMIAVEVHNRMPHQIWFDEDSRYFPNPNRYLVESKESIILPHQRMIVGDALNSPAIDFVFIYGNDKGKGITKGMNEA